MATVIQQPQSKRDVINNAIGMGIGNAVKSGYSAFTNRADEMALQKSISSLGDNPTPRQILDAITNTHTYSPESKQNLFKNYLGAAQFEEVQKKNQANEQVAATKKILDEAKEKKEAEKDMNDALTLVDHSTIDQEQKDALRDKIRKGEASFKAIQQVLKPNKAEEKRKEEEESKNVTQTAFNDLAELVPLVGRSGIITSKLGGDTAKAYAQFTSLTGALEALLVEKVNRGALSNTRFRYITETLLPKPSDTQAEIEGKLTGLATILQLDPSALKGQGKKNDRYQIKDKELPEEVIKDVKKYSGKTITAPDGQKYFSDGEQWLKK